MFITATAPAKVILFGEHAVVYGKPAIAVPVSGIRASASLDTHVPDGHGLRIIAPDLEPARDVDDALSLTARLVFDALGTPLPDANVVVQSQIPIASGLGSGAAVSTALARVLSAAVDCPFDLATLNALIYEVEKVHHGTPSGIDNTVIVYERPVYFVRECPIEHIAIGMPFTLVIADTGQRAPTRESVGDVRKLLETQPEQTQPILDSIAEIAEAARFAIETGNAVELGHLMSSNHQLLQKLTVSSTELDTLIKAAESAGALGAKLSGGGRGGNMIALVTLESAKTIAQALMDAGAYRVISTLVS